MVFLMVVTPLTSKSDVDQNVPPLMSFDGRSVSKSRSGRAKGSKTMEKNLKSGRFSGRSSRSVVNQAISPHHLWIVFLSYLLWLVLKLLSRVSPNLGKKQRCEGFLFSQQKHAFHVRTYVTVISIGGFVCRRRINFFARANHTIRQDPVVCPPG